jgi:ubiquinone/menaquinone biosynthesis C-methylase UbiE
MNHVLDCMPNNPEVIREMFRVLRPGGKVIGAISYEEGILTHEFPVSSNSRHRIYGSEDIQEHFAPFTAEVFNVSKNIPVEVRRQQAIQPNIPILVLRKTV